MSIKATLFALFASLALSVHATVISPAVRSGCENPVAKSTTLIGGRVNLTHFECDTPFVKAPSRRTAAPDAFEARQNSGFFPCTTQPPTCQINALCNFDFCSGSSFAAPLQSDCTALAEALQNAGGTFFVQPGTFVSATDNTCQFRWGNLANQEFEYPLFNFANAAQAVYTNCIIVDGFGGGGCQPSSLEWFIETVVPSAPL